MGDGPAVNRGEGTVALYGVGGGGEKEPLSLGWTLQLHGLNPACGPGPRFRNVLCCPFTGTALFMGGSPCPRFCSGRETGPARLQAVCLDPRPFSRGPEARLGGGPGSPGSFFVCPWTKGPEPFPSPTGVKNLLADCLLGPREWPEGLLTEVCFVIRLG